MKVIYVITALIMCAESALAVSFSYQFANLYSDSSLSSETLSGYRNSILVTAFTGPKAALSFTLDREDSTGDRPNEDVAITRASILAISSSVNVRPVIWKVGITSLDIKYFNAIDSRLSGLRFTLGVGSAIRNDKKFKGFASINGDWLSRDELRLRSIEGEVGMQMIVSNVLTLSSGLLYRNMQINGDSASDISVEDSTAGIFFRSFFVFK